MIVSSFDVGHVNLAFALLSWQRPRASWLTGGPMDPNITPSALLAFFRDHNPDLVAIEWPEIGPRGAGKNILEARTVATKIRTAAELAGIPVMTFSATMWRKAVLGRTKRTKAETIDRICARRPDAADHRDAGEAFRAYEGRGGCRTIRSEAWDADEEDRVSESSTKNNGTTPAPAGQVWVCGACGKRARTRYGFDADNRPTAIDHGWDESCMMNAVLCYEQRGLLTADWRAVEPVPTPHIVLTGIAGDPR